MLVSIFALDATVRYTNVTLTSSGVSSNYHMLDLTLDF